METIETQFGKLCCKNGIGDKDKSILWQWIKSNDYENILLSKYCTYLKLILDKTSERYLEFGVWATPFTSSNNTGFVTEEVIKLITSNYKDKIVTCNDCGYEFRTRITNDSRIRCKRCKSNKSLSILSFYD